MGTRQAMRDEEADLKVQAPAGGQIWGQDGQQAWQSYVGCPHTLLSAYTSCSPGLSV